MKGVGNTQQNSNKQSIVEAPHNMNHYAVEGIAA